MTQTANGGGGHSRAWSIASTIAAIAAVVVSVAALLVSCSQSRESLRLSQASLDQSKKALAATTPKVGGSAQLYNSGVSSATSTQADVTVDFALLNTGDVLLRGCLTYWQYTTLDGTPKLYWPAVVEAGAESWSLTSGQVHETKYTLTVSSGYGIGEKPYVAFWFECKSPHIVTSGTVVGVNLADGSLIGDQVNGLKVLPPSSSWQRYRVIQKATGQPIAPVPTTTPFIEVPEGK